MRPSNWNPESGRVLACALALAQIASPAPRARAQGTEPARALMARAEPADAGATAARGVGPDSTTRVTLTSNFQGQHLARVSRLGLRTILIRPVFGPDGIGFASVDETPASERAPSPALIPWAEVDTLWSRRNMAKGGAVVGALMLGAMFGGVAYGFSKWAEAEGGEKGIALPYFAGGFAIGAVIGGVTGGTIGSFGHQWVKVYPETTPARAPGPRSRRK